MVESFIASLRTTIRELRAVDQLDKLIDPFEEISAFLYPETSRVNSVKNESYLRELIERANVLGNEEALASYGEEYVADVLYKGIAALLLYTDRGLKYNKPLDWWIYHLSANTQLNLTKGGSIGKVIH